MRREKEVTLGYPQSPASGAILHPDCRVLGRPYLGGPGSGLKRHVKAAQPTRCNTIRRQVKAAGSQVAWCRKTGVSRENLNRVLRRRLSPTKSIINALGLRVVYIPKK
jgi:hypothetical protein